MSSRMGEVSGDLYVNRYIIYIYIYIYIICARVLPGNGCYFGK